MSKDLKTKSGTEPNFLHLHLIQTNLFRQKTIRKSQFNKNRMLLLITVMSHSYLRISPPNNPKYYTALCRRKLTFLLLRLVEGSQRTEWTSNLSGKLYSKVVTKRVLSCRKENSSNEKCKKR